MNKFNDKTMTNQLNIYFLRHKNEWMNEAAGKGMYEGKHKIF